MLEFEADGLNSLSNVQHAVGDKGRLFLQPLCSVFDDYPTLVAVAGFQKSFCRSIPLITGTVNFDAGLPILNESASDCFGRETDASNYG
jgi:hypothetical protein